MIISSVPAKIIPDSQDSGQGQIGVSAAGDSTPRPSVVEARGPHADTDAARCVVRRLSETLFDAPRAGGVDAYWTFSAPRFELDSAE